MIGPTHGGRILTVVLNPEPLDAGAWRVRTAWDASAAVITRDVAARGRRSDVVMIGPYEAPQFGRGGYLADLTRMASSDKGLQAGRHHPVAAGCAVVQGQALRVARCTGSRPS
jgi:hypothetical protein